MLDVNVKPGYTEKFKEWVVESNKVISQFDGFVSRRLLEGSDGSLRMMVEFESEKQFAAMRRSEKHQTVHRQAAEFREGPTIPVLYRVVTS